MHMPFTRSIAAMSVILALGCQAMDGDTPHQKEVAIAREWVHTVRERLDARAELERKLVGHGDAAFGVLSRLCDSGEIVSRHRLQRAVLDVMAQINPDRTVAFIGDHVLRKGAKWPKSHAYHLLGDLATPEAVSLLIDGLAEEDSYTCRQVRCAFGRKVAKYAVEPLLSVLAHGPVATRVAAAQSLSELPRGVYDPRRELPCVRITETAFQRLADPSPAVRRALVHSLIHYDRARFERCFEHPDPVVREAAVDWVRMMRDRSLPEEVVKATRDPAPGVRRVAALAMKDQRIRTAPSVLLVLLHDEDQQVRANARQSLMSRKDTWERTEVEPLLTDADLDNRSLAPPLLARCVPTPIDQLLAMADDSTVETSVRRAATQALVAIDGRERVIPFVRGLLDDPQRLAWAGPLGTAPAPSFAPWPFSMRYVYMKPPGTAAVLALISHGDSQDAVRIVNCVGEGHLPAWTCGLLHRMGTKATPALVAALRSGNATVRLASLSSLARFASDQQARNTVRGLLRDKDSGVRAHAALSLGCLRDTESRESLFALLADDDRRTRAYAASALVMLGDKRGEPLAFSWHRERFVNPMGRGKDYLSGLFLMKHALPIGTTKARVAEFLLPPHGTKGEGNYWFYQAGPGMGIDLSFKDDVLVKVHPDPNEGDEPYP